MFSVQAARASNLPSSNGASGKYRGSVAALTPIVKMSSLVDEAIATLPDLQSIRSKLTQAQAIDILPLKEKDFKRLFDEYSLDVSYKQRYLDSNAFLVYYTGGFDGLGRGSIEQEDPTQKLMVAQYGYRNDAWVAIDEARAELDYLLSSSSPDGVSLKDKDLKGYLNDAKRALDAYIGLAPPLDVHEAKSKVAATFQTKRN